MKELQELLDEQAKDICAQLGSAYLQKKRIDDQIDSLEKALVSLNSLAPQLRKIVQDSKSEQE